MIVLIFVLILFIGSVIMRHPEMLLGVEASTAHRHELQNEELRKATDEIQALKQVRRSAEALASQLEEENIKLRTLNAELKNRLAQLDSLKNREWAIFHHSNSVSLTFILQQLHATADQTIRDEVISLLGSLIEEGRVERDLANDGYYKAAKR
jgi:hypothetical protein